MTPNSAPRTDRPDRSHARVYTLAAIGLIVAAVAAMLVISARAEAQRASNAAENARIEAPIQKA